DGTGVGDGAALHFDGHRVGAGDDIVFLRLASNKLVAGGNPAGINLDALFPAGFSGQLHQLRVGRETGDKGIRVRQDIIFRGNPVQVVVKGVGRNDDVPHLCFPAASGDADVDDSIDAEPVDQHLAGEGRIDLADAAADQHHIGAADFSLIKCTSGPFRLPAV